MVSNLRMQATIRNLLFSLKSGSLPYRVLDFLIQFRALLFGQVIFLCRNHPQSLLLRA